MLGGWAALRTMLIAPPWTAPPAGTVSAAVASRARPAPRPEWTVSQALPTERAVAGGRLDPATAAPPPARSERRRLWANAATPFLESLPAQVERAPDERRFLPPVPVQRAALPARPGPSVPSRRWSLSAWSFVRSGGASTLADRGLLGGSQTGARISYRLGGGPARPLAFSARFSLPLKRPAGAEAALGVDWKPARKWPVHVLAERRQALGREGRSAFAVTVYGGVGDARLGPLRIDAYAQAGLVGARSRDPFADGSLRFSLPLGGRIRLGAGAWGAAQPGLARFDLGPQAAFRLPVAGRAISIAADWRVRAAGNAGPGSGPTLTVATDF
ncbi:MAG TPA: hypothetical protein VE891_06060 [Allosphingosinicella sp.]|nr:hypothetical protein [Allosphingosinicella sp.]